MLLLPLFLLILLLLLPPPPLLNLPLLAGLVATHVVVFAVTSAPASASLPSFDERLAMGVFLPPLLKSR